MSLASLREALKALPSGLREPLIDEFGQALSEYRAGDWEKVGLKAGKFCEIAYCVCLGHASGSFPDVAFKPANFFKSCVELEKQNLQKGRSLCIQVPRILIGVYELRNNRAIGHVHGEVQPNHMDAEYFVRAMKWVMAEFVRHFSQLPLNDSHAVVEAVTARSFQIIWKNGDIRRVLEPARNAAQKVLICLYAEARPVEISQLQKWIEYKNTTEFKQKVIEDLHKKALVHFNRTTGTVEILPPGQIYVETTGLLLVAAG